MSTLSRFGTTPSLWIGVFALHLAVASPRAQAVQGVPASDPKAWAKSLFSDRPVAAELARRRLCLVDKASVPEAILRPMLRHADPAVVARAWSVLRAHRFDLTEAGLALFRAGPRQRVLALGVVPLDRLRAALTDDDADVRRAALHELEDRGQLAPEELAAGLRDAAEPVARAAVGIGFEERAAVDPLLLDAVAEDRDARRRVLRALAQRPRTNAVRWVRRWLTPATAKEDWLEVALLLAALPSAALERADAQRLVRIAAELDQPMDDPTGVAPSTAQRVLARLPARHADALVGTTTRWLADGLTLDRFLQCIERSSALGEAQCIPLLYQLDAEDVDRLCSWLEARSSTVFRAHLADALDGKAPLAPYVLRRAAPLLADGPPRAARTARLVALIRDRDPELDADTDAAVLAFQALTGAGHYDDVMVQFALVEDPVTTGRWSQPAQRVRALLQVPFERLPQTVWNELLDHPREDVVVEALRALRRGPVFAGWADGSGRAIEAKLRRVVEGGPGKAKGAAVRSARVAVLGAKGGREVMAALFARSPKRRAALIESLVHSPRPFSRALLVEWAKSDPGLAVACWFARARLGDAVARRHVLSLLDQPKPAVEARPLRRARDAMIEHLDAADRPRVASILARCGDDTVLREVLGWVFERPDLLAATETTAAARAVLHRLARDVDDFEIRDLATRVLLRIEDESEQSRVLESLGRALTDDARDAVYALVDAAPSPLSEPILNSLIRVLLVAPLDQPEEEIEASLEQRVGRGEYPLQRVVVRRLMAEIDACHRAAEQDPAALDAKRALLASIRTAGARHRVEPAARVAVTRRRYTALALAAHADPDLGEAFRPALVRCLGAAPPSLEHDSGAQPTDGVGALLAARELSQAGRDAEAATAYQVAIRSLIRRPLPPLAERALIGERSILHQSQPRARLVARMWLCRARAATQASAREQALRSARAAARGDAEARSEVERFRPAKSVGSDKERAK